MPSVLGTFCSMNFHMIPFKVGLRLTILDTAVDDKGNGPQRGKAQCLDCACCNWAMTLKTFFGGGLGAMRNLASLKMQSSKRWGLEPPFSSLHGLASLWQVQLVGATLSLNSSIVTIPTTYCITGCLQIWSTWIWVHKFGYFISGVFGRAQELTRISLLEHFGDTAWSRRLTCQNFSWYCWKHLGRRRFSHPDQSTW